MTITAKAAEHRHTHVHPRPLAHFYRDLNVFQYVTSRKSEATFECL